MKKGPVITIVAGICALACAATLWGVRLVQQPVSPDTGDHGVVTAPAIPTGPNFTVSEGLVQAADKFSVGQNQWKIPAPVGQGMQKYYSQTIEWGSCEPFGVETDVDTGNQLTCGWLLVPADYSRPDGPTIAIAVSQVAAGNGNMAAPHLIVNPGGPGYSGLQFAADMATNNYLNTSIRDSFSVVGFAPRGVGESVPPIRCVGSSTWHRLVADNTGVSSDGVETDDGPNGAGSIRQNLEKDFGKYFADRCGQFTAQGFEGIQPSDVVEHSSTADVARDLDVLRAVLGDSGLSYLGYSYGTAIGQEYSQQFPNNVRALVLDGNVDPGWTNPALYSEFHQVYGEDHPPASIEQGTAQALNLQSAQRFATSCMSGKLSVGGRLPCVLEGATPQEGLDHITEDIADAEISNPKTGESVSLGRDGAMAVIGMVAKDTGNWVTLNAKLAELKETGRSTWIDEEYGSEADDEVEGNFSGAPKFAFDAYAVVTCSDYPEAFRPAYCAGMKTAGKLSPVDHPGGPILIVDATFDPQTPFVWGVVAGKVLGAQILSVASTGHGISFNGIECLDNTVASFLGAPQEALEVEPGKDVDEQKDQYSNIGAGLECQLV